MHLTCFSMDVLFVWWHISLPLSLPQCNFRRNFSIRPAWRHIGMSSSKAPEISDLSLSRLPDRPLNGKRGFSFYGFTLVPYTTRRSGDQEHPRTAWLYFLIGPLGTRGFDHVPQKSSFLAVSAICAALQCRVIQIVSAVLVNCQRSMPCRGCRIRWRRATQ